MCFLAGANAIFTGERMLTTPTSGWDEDISMLDRWGMTGMKSSSEHVKRETEAEGYGVSPALAQSVASETSGVLL